MLFQVITIPFFVASCVLTADANVSTFITTVFEQTRLAKLRASPETFLYTRSSLRAFIKKYFKSSKGRKIFESGMLASINNSDNMAVDSHASQFLTHFIISCLVVLDNFGSEICESIEKIMARALVPLTETNCELIGFMKCISGKKLDDCWVPIGEYMASVKLGMPIYLAFRKISGQSGGKKVFKILQAHYLKIAELCRRVLCDSCDNWFSERGERDRFKYLYHLLTRDNLYEYLRLFEEADLKPLQSTFDTTEERDVIYSIYIQSRFGRNQSNVIKDFCTRVDQSLKQYEFADRPDCSFPQFSKLATELQIYIFSLTDIVTQIFAFPGVSRKLFHIHNVLLTSSQKLQREFISSSSSGNSFSRRLPWCAIFKDSMDLPRYFIHVVKSVSIENPSVFYRHSNAFLTAYCDNMHLMNLSGAKARDSYVEAFIVLIMAEKRYAFPQEATRPIKFRQPKWMSTADYARSIEILVLQHAIFPKLPSKFNSIVKLWALFGESKRSLLEAIITNSSNLSDSLETTCANSLLHGCKFPEELAQFLSTKSKLMRKIKERNLTLPLDNDSIVVHIDLFREAFSHSTEIYKKDGIVQIVGLIAEYKNDKETLYNLVNSIPHINILIFMLNNCQLFTVDSFREISEILFINGLIERYLDVFASRLQIRLLV